VGKSSLLNALVGERLARISATPGKTRLLNVYEVRFTDPDRKGQDAYLLDLPGYGYARASKSERAGYRALLGGALDRPALRGVMWLLDLRRDPSLDDRAILELLGASGAHVLAALTKSDAVPRTDRGRREQTLRNTLRLDADQVLVTSARTGEGIEALRLALGALLSHPPTGAPA
jgi:GTP-binding protein